MALKLGSLYLLISGKSEPLKQELNKAYGLVRTGATKMTSVMNKATRAMFSVPGLLLTGGLAYGLKRATQDVLHLAGEQEAAEKRVAAVIKSTGQAAGFTTEQLKEMAAGMQRLTTTGDEAILAGQAILLTFKQIRGEAFERATMAALDLSEVMQMDLRSSIIQIGKALNDPIANLGALGRAGIQFTKDQKEMIKSLWEAGKVAEAQRIILKELESQFGGAAKAARETFAGGLKALGNTIGDIKEQIGFALMPVITELVNRFKDWVDNNRILLTQDIPDFIRRIGDAAKFTFDIISKLDKAFDAVFGGKLTTTIKEAYLDQLQKQRKELENYLVVLETIEQEESDQYRRTQQQLDLTKRKILLTQQEIIENQKLANLDQVTAAAFKDVDEAAKKVTGTLKTLSRESSASEVVRQTKELDKALEHLMQRDINRADVWDAEFRHAQDVEGQYDRTAERAAKASAEIDNALTAFFMSVDETEKKMSESSSRWVELSEHTASAMQSNFSSLFYDAIKGKLKTLEDYLNAIFDSLLRAWSDLMGQMATEWIFGDLKKAGGGGGIFAGIGAAISGGAGPSAWAMRFDNPVQFQHGGHIGEGVIGRGLVTGRSYQFDPNETIIPDNKLRGGAANVTINLKNESGVPLEAQSSGVRANYDRLIADVIIKRKINSRGFRDSLRA